MADACNAAILGGQSRGLFEVRSLRPAWATQQDPVSTKITEVIRAWWCMPIVPVAWEAKLGGSLEP